MHNVYGCVNAPCDAERAPGTIYCFKCGEEHAKLLFTKALIANAGKSTPTQG